MGIFQIEVGSLAWIDGSADDPQDLCLHGHVRVQIGQRVLEDDATVSATALYLLKTLTEDKRMEPHSIQMLPCCGFFMIANKELTEVEIIGCDHGTDWSVIHQDGKIRLILPDGAEETVEMEEYRQQVYRFADTIEAFYRQCTPKELPQDSFDRNGYQTFWKEWHRRRNQVSENDGR